MEGKTLRLLSIFFFFFGGGVEWHFYEERHPGQDAKLQPLLDSVAKRPAQK